MAESTEDLREQVARLLFEADPQNLHILWRDAKDSPVAIAAEWVKSTYTLADSLLPLFAARERAAAEKGWDDATHAELDRLAARVQPDGMIDQHELARPVTNPYTVRAQLEGDGA